MKKFITATALLLAVLVVNAAETIGVFAPDFSKPETFNGKTAYFEMQKNLVFDTVNGKKVMVLRRGAPDVKVRFREALTENTDYGYSFNLKRDAVNSAFVVSFGGKGFLNAPGSVFFNSNRSVYILGKDKKWKKTDIALRDDREYKIYVHVSNFTKKYSVVIPGVGEAETEFDSMPSSVIMMLNPQAPDNNVNYISNLKVYRHPSRAVGKENGMIGADVIIDDPNTSKQSIGCINDGNTSTSVGVTVNKTITVNLPRRIEAKTIQVYGGLMSIYENPSGACAPAGYVVEGFNNGNWQVLCKAENLPDLVQFRDLDDEKLFFRHDITPLFIDSVRIRFTSSHDTRKRMGGKTISDAETVVHVREIEILSSQDVVKKAALTDLLQVEYRLPIYRNRDRAELTVVAKDHPETPSTAEIIIQSSDKKTVFQKKINIKKGRHNYIVDNIGNLPAGRYVTFFKTEKGEIRRLLRIERQEEIKAPEKILNMAGKKLFFTPDAFSLKERKNLKISIFPAEMKQHAKTPGEDRMLLNATAFYRSADNKFVFVVNDYPRGGFVDRKPATRFLVADKLEGPYNEVEKRPAYGSNFNPGRPFHNFQFAQLPGNTKFVMYDKSVHREIPLNNIRRVWSAPPKDYGCIKAPFRTHWAVGKALNGEWVFMRDKQILTDIHLFGSEEFETGFTTNDNFGDMWLANDGRELFLAHGQTVRRFAPYAVPYDNLPMCFRLMTIYSTRDGINWQYRHTMTLPDEKDSDGAQHYGSMMLPIADGDLYLVYLFAYDGETQQIYVDLNYSRDGLHFYRFPDTKPFISTDDPNDWYFGHVFVKNQYVKEGKYLYQMAGYCSDLPHFVPEVTTFLKGRKATADDFERRFESRDLSRRLTYFDKIGGYQGVADIGNRGCYYAGTAKYRVDGWFGLEAGDNKGSFVTNDFNGVKKITANAVVKNNGFIKLEIVGKDGKLIKQIELKGDDLELPVCELDPTQEFFIRGTMKNAELYTLNFK